MDETRLSAPNRTTGQPGRYGQVLHRLLQLANQGSSRLEFLHLAASYLLSSSLSDTVEIWVSDAGKPYVCRTIEDDEGSRIECRIPAVGERGPSATAVSPLDGIMMDILQGRFASVAPFSTRSGSFWTGDTARPVLIWDRKSLWPSQKSVVIGGEYASLLILPVPVEVETRGVLLLGSRKEDFFSRDDIPFFEALAEMLGVAIAFQTSQWALRERVKELTCLYGIAQVARNPNLAPGDSLKEIVALLPNGWQYPELTSARITLDGTSYETERFLHSRFVQTSDIVVNEVHRGVVEVLYRQETQEFDEGPFLKEERKLIDEVARQVGFLVDHWEHEEEARRLRNRLGLDSAS